MPTKRTRILRYSQVDLHLNTARKSHLICGHYLIPNLPGFVDDDHRRACWFAHRDRVIADAATRGRVPKALHDYEGAPARAD